MISGGGRLNSFLILDEFYNRLKMPLENKEGVVVENFDAMPSHFPHAQVVICLFINSFNISTYQRNQVEIDSSCSCNCYSMTGADGNSDLNAREAAELVAQRFITYCFKNISNASNLDNIKIGDNTITEFKPLSILRFDMQDKIETLHNIVAYQFNFNFKVGDQIPVDSSEELNRNNFSLKVAQKTNTEFLEG